MKLKDNSTQEIDTALYQLEQRLKSNIRLTDVENSNASSAEINAVDKKLTEEVKDRQSADEKLQDNINKEIADRQEADAAIENAKQDKLIAGNNIQINGNVISATPAEYTAEAPVKVTDGKISLDTVPITKGGTGVTTQADINKAFIANLEVGNSDVTDGTEFVSSWASDNGFAETAEGALNKPYKRQFIKVWNYIKDKISSVLGLTKDNYGGKAATAGTADTVDNYHASQLWRSDGAIWNPQANVSLNAAANGDEWSFDIRRNGHTGCYWHVWDSSHGSLLRVNADDGKVSAPYGFVGNLSGKADTAGTADSATQLTSKNSEMLVTNNITVEDFAKTVTYKYTAGTLLSRSNWSWAESRYIVLNSSVSVDTQRYSCLVVREGNLNDIWAQHSLLFIPTYMDKDVLYLVQMTVSSTAGSVSTTVLPILSSKGGTFTGAVTFNNGMTVSGSETHNGTENHNTIKCYNIKCSERLIIPTSVSGIEAIEDGRIWIS